jgi:hypothetical protein
MIMTGDTRSTWRTGKVGGHERNVQIKNDIPVRNNVTGRV